MTEYDISGAFKAIEDELIASMIRNMDRHRAEETKEGIQWSMWQAEPDVPDGPGGVPGTTAGGK